MNKKSLIIAVLIYCLMMKYMQHVILPFILAVVCFFAFKPIIDFLERCFHIKRSAIGVSLLLVVYFTLIVVVGSIITYGFIWLFHFIESVPIYYDDIFIPFLNQIMTYVENEIPFLMSEEGLSIFNNVLEQSLYGMMTLFSTLITQIPQFLFSFFIFIISTFFLFIEYEEIKSKLISICPQKNILSFIKIKDQTMKSIRMYLKCQVILMFISFCILFIGFLVLRIHHSFLYACVTALLDCLPFIGVGIILIPLCVVCVFQKAYLNAFYIFLVYLIINVTRSLLEPHIMNKQIKIPSFLLLLSMTIHLYFFGLIGVILSPIHMNLIYCLLDYYHQTY